MTEETKEIKEENKETTKVEEKTKSEQKTEQKVEQKAPAKDAEEKGTKPKREKQAKEQKSRFNTSHCLTHHKNFRIRRRPHPTSTLPPVQAFYPLSDPLRNSSQTVSLDVFSNLL